MITYACPVTPPVIKQQQIFTIHIHILYHENAVMGGVGLNLDAVDRQVNGRLAHAGGEAAGEERQEGGPGADQVLIQLLGKLRLPLLIFRGVPMAQQKMRSAVAHFTFTVVNTTCPAIITITFVFFEPFTIIQVYFSV